MTSDNLPTMGEQAEADIIKATTCTCGQPQLPGIQHRQDGPCFQIDTNDGVMTPNPQTGAQRGNYDEQGAAIKAEDTFLDRLKVEHHDLDIRGMKLSMFVKTNPSFGLLPVRDRELLVKQLTVMSELFGILSERIFRATNPEMAATADAAEAEERAQQMNDLAKHTGAGEINGSPV